MNRLQKKCFAASAGVHLLLAIILFIGPGFISHQTRPDDLAILNFVPVKTVDELVAPGGGNPKAKSPSAAPVRVRMPVMAVSLRNLRMGDCSPSRPFAFSFTLT